MSLDRILAILGLVLAVIGVYLAWYFYRASLPTRTPTFLIDPVRATVVDTGSSATSDITIQYRGRPIGPKAVNVVRVYFWNSGTTPITSAEILRPLTITVAGNESEILDTKVLKVSRDLTGITLTPQEGTRNKANAKFDLLETDDGAVLQITYAGPRDAELKFDGATIGAPHPTIRDIINPQQIVQKKLSPILKVISGLGVVIPNMIMTFVLIVSSIPLIPSARTFVYRNIFGSDKTDDEIQLSALRLVPKLLFSGIFVTYVILFVQAGEISGEIPSALIVKD